jgi:Mitochondrial calcium uniporter
MKIYKGPLEQLRAAEAELAVLIKTRDEIEKLSQRHSSRMLYLAFGNCFAQLGGMGYLIFGLYGWEVMESITYMVCKYFKFSLRFLYSHFLSDVGQLLLLVFPA